MSASGQGDQIDEINKDDEAEISSTAPDNGDVKSSVSNTDEIAVPIVVSTTEPLEFSHEDSSVIPTPESADGIIASSTLDIDSNIASTAKSMANDDSGTSVMEAEIGTGQTTDNAEVGDYEDDIPEVRVTDAEPKLSLLKDVNDLVQNNDKDSSSLGEELVLRWEDDDDDEINDTIPTDDVLKQLDRELENMELLNKAQEDDNEAEAEQPESQIEIDNKNIMESTITESVQDSSKMKDNIENINQDVQLQPVIDVSDKNERNIKEISIKIDESSKAQDVVEMAGSSFEESENIINEIDNLIKDSDDTSIAKSMDTSNTVEKPQTISEVDSLTEENPEQDIDMEKVSVETEKPDEKKKELDDMDVDVSEEKSDDPVMEKSTLTSIESPDHPDTTDILDNEDKDQNIGVIKPKDMEENEDVIEKTDSVESISQSDVPSILHSNITDNDEEKNKDCQIEAASQPTDELLELSKKLTQESGTKKDIKDIQVDVSKDVPIIDTTITRAVHHSINKPNVMLDIPTQELSDIEAELDEDELDSDNEDNVEKSGSKPEIDMKEPSNTEITEPNVSISTPIRPAIEIDATTSKLNIKTVSPAKSDQSDLKPTSEPEKIIDDDKKEDDEISTLKMAKDDEMSSSKLAKDDKPKITKEYDDEKPSTSKGEGATSEKLTPDTDDVQEVTDSLGLLAESSRVMDDDNDDDDDEADDQEADDNEDDEDFDPYEESNSEMAEDMDDSNTPPPELDPKSGVTVPTPVLVGTESYEGTMDINDDIECVENELPEMELNDGAASETPSNEGNADKEDVPEIIDADAHKQITSKCPPEKIINILEKVLGQQVKTGAKTKDLSCNVKNYVELEGSSDSDDVTEVPKSDAPTVSVKPNDIDVMSTSGASGTSDIVSKEGEVVISRVLKRPPQKTSTINTSEVSIKTTESSAPSIPIPETTSDKTKTAKEVIFSLDSDEEDTEKVPSNKEENAKKRKHRICINVECQSDTEVYYHVDRVTANFYSHTRKGGVVCEQCRMRASERNEALISGVKDLRPFLDLDMTTPSQQLVEISDSDSDGEGGEEDALIGEKGATFLEDHLVDMINETWTKYKMESRLRDTESYLMKELEKMEAGAKEINAMLNECQKKTDEIRCDFYKDYGIRRKALSAITIHDTPFSSFCCLERKQSSYSTCTHSEKETEEVHQTGSRYPKRRAASIADIPAKRPAIPMGYTPLEGDKMVTQSDVANDQSKEDDKEDISVVTLSAESAPADLPPYGEINRPPLKTGMVVYAMRNAFGTWLKGRIMEVIAKTASVITQPQFTQCRVKFEHKVKNPCKVLAARCLAYPEPAEVRMVIGTRVVALFKDPHNTARRDSFYSGVVAEIPNPVNSYRYLVFFDDGYAQYVRHQDTRIVCESNKLVWEEVHPFIREFIKTYLTKYPERPMVRLHAGEKLKTEWNGKWWDSHVLRVDASIALINFDEDDRTEWIYRGSTRLAPLYLELQAAEKAGEGKARSRLPRSKAQMRSNMPCVEYTRSDEQASAKATAETQALQQHNEEMRRQRAVAKKSTTTAAQTPAVAPYEGVVSRVVYYTPKNAVRPHKMITHTCSIKCRRSDLLSLKDLRTYNPLAKPLLSGWERQTVRFKGHKEVLYRAPCGRRLRNMQELHTYLRILQSDLSVDLFDFTVGTHCLAEFVLHKCNVSKKDLSHGKENVPVPCVNYYDESLPEFCSYNTERTPTAGVPLNLDPEFLCGCDCTDDCMDKTKCACWKMTLEGAKTIGLDDPNVGYMYRRLPEPLPSGIYECNSRCKCKNTCLNRVAQHPLQLKLQVFKTINRGWGIRALNDVPKGSFLCVYAGNLLTDATANLDGLNEGDEYLAELDYIEVVEAMKEGYEEDVPDADKKLDKKRNSSESESEPSSESEDERDKTEKDGDFQPGGYIPHSNFEFKKSLRERRENAKKMEQVKAKEEIKKKDDCITISDDEEVREPSRFTAQAGMVDRGLISKQSSRVSVRTLFGKDEACYIMDAKVQGNIGRYLNHSCHPNVFVQNVFVDTHDPRFPWVAFFALSHVRAGTELTWNYNYDIGSVPEKVLYCYCGAPNCRGRLL